MKNKTLVILSIIFYLYKKSAFSYINVVSGSASAQAPTAQHDPSFCFVSGRPGLVNPTNVSCLPTTKVFSYWVARPNLHP